MLPDGPTTPILYQKIQWMTHPVEFLETCAQQYGDIFTARVTRRTAPLVFVSNPQAIQEIFTADCKTLESGEETGIKLLFLGENSLISLSGEKHRRQRKLLTPPFHGERMRAYGELMQNITQKVTNQWQIGEPFSMLKTLQQISFEVILQAIFGLHEGTRYDQLKQLLRARLNATSEILSSTAFFFSVLQKDLGQWSPWGRIKYLEKQVDELIYAEIEQRRSHKHQLGNDILSLMMSAVDEQGNPMTKEELRDELITLLIAGQESIATSLAWAFYWIHSTPGILDKLLQELHSLGKNPELSQITKLPYLTAVCYENLRISPVVIITFQRIVKSPFKMMGYQFEPGTLLAPCIYLTHHHKDIYPEPKMFQPERFLNRQYSPYEYLPFGGGNRHCIGHAFALYEMKIVLATILSQWYLKLVETQPVKPIRRGLLLSPAKGVTMVATEKR